MASGKGGKPKSSIFSASIFGDPGHPDPSGICRWSAEFAYAPWASDLPVVSTVNVCDIHMHHVCDVIVKQPREHENHDVS